MAVLHLPRNVHTPDGVWNIVLKDREPVHLPAAALLLLLLSVPALMLLAAAPATAAELTLRQGRYHSVERWDSFPDSNAQATVSDWRGLLPELEPQALSQLSYQESYFTAGYNLAALGLRGRQSGQLSLIYYSPAGYAYLLRRALPLPRSGRLYAGLELPAGEVLGVLRVLLWSQQPEPGSLQQLMQHPLAPGPEIPGLIGQQWLERQRPGAAVPPWLDPFAAQDSAPLGFEPRDWPFCFARVDDRGQILLKDCVVNSTGRAVSDPRDYRNYVWELHWGDELVLSFALPQELELQRAELRLAVSTSGAALPGGTGLGSEELVVEVNGWDTAQLGSGRTFGGALQPEGLSVSHYLRSGVNQIRLRAPALAGQSWLIHRIELWID